MFLWISIWISLDFYGYPCINLLWILDPGQTTADTLFTSILSSRERTKPADDLAASSAADAAATAAEAASAAAMAAAQAADTAEASRKSAPPLPHPNETTLQMFDRILRHELDRIQRADCEDLMGTADRDEASECPELAGIREAAAHFARAQNACEFDAAVRAAEAAAAEAPPEMAEEAAVSRAREYRTEIVKEVHEVVPGERLVEVVGYVGITRPNK